MPRKKKTSKKTTAKLGSKAEFVRSMPTSMPVKKVVQEAAKVGLTITENHVYGVRSAAKKNAKKAPKSVVKKTAKKAAPKVAKTNGKAKSAKKRKAKLAKTQSKRQYVLGLPKGLSASEVVANAKRDGISLTTKYVYNIRGQAKSAKKNARRANKPQATPATFTPKSVVRTAPRTGSVEEQFVDILAAIGVVKAETLVKVFKDRVKQIRLV